MPWGYKRRRDVDFTTCCDCSDPIDMENEDWFVCGECGEALCSECMRKECDVCKSRDENGLDLVTEGSSCCEACMESCEQCGEDDDCSTAYVHKMCMTEHLENCNAMTRSEGKYKAARKRREEKENKLESAKAQLANLKRTIESLSKDVENARQAEEEAKGKMESTKQVEAGDVREKKPET